jgi:WD40 repeat protein
LVAKLIRLLVASILSLALLVTLRLHVRDDVADCIVLHDPGTPSTTRTKPADWVQVVAFSRDGALLASGLGCPGCPGCPGTCQLWDVPRRQVRAVLPAASAVSTAAFAPDGQTLALGSWDGAITLWDIASGRETPWLQLQADRALALAFSPDGTALIAGTHTSVVLWDLPSGRERATLAGSYPLAFSPDGKTLATGNLAGGDPGLWDWKRGQARGDLRQAPSPLGATSLRCSLALAFTPDGKTLISADGDRFLRLWDVDRQRLRATAFKYADQYAELAFSPDRQVLATGGAGRTIRLWDVARGHLLATLQGHTGGIIGVAFAPDGQALASGGFDGTVRLWNVAGILAGMQTGQ